MTVPLLARRHPIRHIVSRAVPSCDAIPDPRLFVGTNARGRGPRTRRIQEPGLPLCRLRPRLLPAFRRDRPPGAGRGPVTRIEEVQVWRWCCKAHSEPAGLGPLLTQRARARDAAGTERGPHSCATGAAPAGWGRLHVSKRANSARRRSRSALSSLRPAAVASGRHGRPPPLPRMGSPCPCPANTGNLNGIDSESATARLRRGPTAPRRMPSDADRAAERRQRRQKDEEKSMVESKGTPRHFFQRPVDVDHLLDHLPNKSVN